jgi:tetratricopeptide (TPR) repeat protein
MPDPATPAKRPHEIVSSDELFLNGQHLEQYRHATYQPEPYYLEALRRDPLDSRCNNAMGLLLYRRGKFAEAETYFRSAIKSVTRRNPNPYDCEPFYNLGLALKMQGKRREAFDAFYKAIWDSAYQDSGYFELARLATYDGRYEEAFDLVERSIRRNASHHAARHLKITLLRHLDRAAEAQAEIQTALALDSMNFGVLYEKHLLDGDVSYQKLMRGDAHTFSEISLDYAHAGLFTEAIALLSEAELTTDPISLYLLGWYHAQIDQRDEAARVFAQAACVAPDYCFPNRLETVPALECALKFAPNDARAPYYLGNFWYGHRRYDEAIACWERARSLDPNFPTVNRNLGLAYLNKQNDPHKALEAYEQAFRLDPTDARVFAELDGIYKRLNVPSQERLERLEQHLDLVEMRDDLTVERAALLNLLGRPQEALALLMSRNFHPWEGGEGKVTGQYNASLIDLARRALADGDYDEALVDLERTQSYPYNLGEGKLYSIRENNVHYYLGCACEGLGRDDEAQKHFVEASLGVSEPTLAMYYNDQPPDMIYYQGLALQKLGQPRAAQAIFQKLIAYANAHMNDTMRIDYFAVSLPDFVASDEDLDRFNRVHCEYLLALAYSGIGDETRAQTHFDTVLKLNPYHLGATIHRTQMPTA